MRLVCIHAQIWCPATLSFIASFKHRTWGKGMMQTNAGPPLHCPNRSGDIWHFCQSYHETVIILGEHIKYIKLKLFIGAFDHSETRKSSEFVWKVCSFTRLNNAWLMRPTCQTREKKLKRLALSNMNDSQALPASMCHEIHVRIRIGVGFLQMQH